MSVLHTASFKEFGSLMCLWQALKLWKTQLEVRSLNVTWRRDLWGQEVKICSQCVKVLYEQLCKNFRYPRKTWGPPAVRGLNKRLAKNVFLHAMIQVCVLLKISNRMSWNSHILLLIGYASRMQKFKLVTCILIAIYYIEVGNVF